MIAHDLHVSYFYLFLLVFFFPHYILDRIGGNVQGLLLVHHSLLRYVASPGDRLGCYFASLVWPDESDLAYLQN